MSERSYVEIPFLEWLAGKPADPTDRGLGWTYRSPKDMEAFDRPESDPIVEDLLRQAIRRINTSVDDDGQALRVIAEFRKLLNKPDPLDANRSTLDALRDGIPIVLRPGEDATTVHLIAFDSDRQHLNDFTVTNQYPVRGAKKAIADTVLLVNGIPVVVLEYKSVWASGHDWKEGVRQAHRYMREAPALLAPNVFCVAADEAIFRYGTVNFQPRTERDVEKQREFWSPWLSQYPTQRLYWTLPSDQQDPDPLRAAACGLLQPRNVLDFLESFVVFETRRGRTIKKIARYQQFEAANDVVDRVVEGRHKTGLLWHTTGSGKSLTMLFTAYKLRHQSRLKNPTVFIVVDRTDLKTQISDDFDDCDYPNVTKAMGVEDLKAKIRTDRRETVVTTIQCFQRMNDLQPNQRDNIILLIDEAHRSQKGDGAGFAMTMRAKLPNASRYGLTGTPIDRTMINTHRDFGPVIDGQQERYLSYYGIRQAIRDGATLPVHYLPSYIPFAVDEKALNISFEQMCEQMEIEDQEEKDMVQRREARWKALVKDERRIQRVVGDIVDHFLKYPDPSGFKAQVVTVDREACARYKAELDQQLQARGLPAEWSEVVISSAQNDSDELRRFHYDKAKTDELIEWFKLTPMQWEAANRQKHGPEASKWKPPLKILIVCDRLLTGFDAPVEQVMYLDKPLRDHNLLQAMARTNRPLPEMNKLNGLIVDYFGVFNDLQKALNFDESVREEAAINWDRLKEQVPLELGRCMVPFHGIKIDDTRDCLLACLRRLSDSQVALEFETNFKHLEALWEALSPDESLYPYRHEYAWLCAMYIAHRRRNRRDAITHDELAQKTRELIHQFTELLVTAEDVPVYKVDVDYLVKVQSLPTAADRAAELEAALTAELVDGPDGFAYKQLGERLKQAVEAKQNDDEAALRFLREAEEIVYDVNAIKTEPQRLGLTQTGEFELYTVIKAFAATPDEALCVQAAKAMIKHLRDKHYLPAGWSATLGGRKRVSLELQILSWDAPFDALQLAPTDLEDAVFLRTAVEELAKVIP